MNNLAGHAEPTEAWAVRHGYTPCRRWTDLPTPTAGVEFHHTAGPWRHHKYPLREEFGGGHGFRVYGPHTEIIATFASHNLGTDRVEPVAELNAMLMASAPELLAELEKITNLPADDDGNRTIPAGFLDSSRKVIAKARGGRP